MQEAATLFGTLADSQRLRILNLLYPGDSACVCEIVDALRIPQYQVSRQLRVLRDAGLVTSEKRGAWVYYGAPRDLPPLARAILGDLAVHLGEKMTKEDRERFVARLQWREGGVCAVGYPADVPYREQIPVVNGYGPLPKGIRKGKHQ